MERNKVKEYRNHKKQEKVPAKNPIRLNDEQIKNSLLLLFQECLHRGATEMNINVDMVSPDGKSKITKQLQFSVTEVAQDGKNPSPENSK